MQEGVGQVGFSILTTKRRRKIPQAAAVATANNRRAESVSASAKTSLADED
jgi:hypothetical protein